MSTSSHLLPCPFCGSQPRVLEYQSGFNPRRIICDTCRLHKESNGRDTADDLWNKRYTPDKSQSPEFLRYTNESYAAWCRTYYIPDSLDEAGHRNLDGLWAWQAQELSINDHLKVIDNLTRELISASAHLAGCTSAYEKHASRHASVGKAVSDPFFTTRVQDFNRTVDEVREAAKVAVAYRNANQPRAENGTHHIRDRLKPS